MANVWLLGSLPNLPHVDKGLSQIYQRNWNYGDLFVGTPIRLVIVQGTTILLIPAVYSDLKNMFMTNRYPLHPEPSQDLKSKRLCKIFNTWICIQLLGDIIYSLKNNLSWIYQIKLLRLPAGLYEP